MATKGVSDRLSREEFMNQLLTFMSERGSPIQRIPSLGGREVDLYQLFYGVLERGGASPLVGVLY